ncbi:MAG: hypothetical protein ACYC4H_13060 [Desulfocucumaceae bacterium]
MAKSQNYDASAFQTNPESENYGTATRPYVPDTSFGGLDLLFPCRIF